LGVAPSRARPNILACGDRPVHSPPFPPGDSRGRNPRAVGSPGPRPRIRQPEGPHGRCRPQSFPPIVPA
jgi:hypothetical protein